MQFLVTDCSRWKRQAPLALLLITNRQNSGWGGGLPRFLSNVPCCHHS